MFRNAIAHISDFYNLNKHEELFNVLQKIIPFKSGYIFFINPDEIRIDCSYNSKIKEKEFSIDKTLGEELFQGIFSSKFKDFVKKLNITHEYIAEPLKIKNTIFGILLIEGENFSENDKLVFKSCAATIANITKDKEINKIIAMQIKALQENIQEINSENKKIKQTDKIRNNFLTHVSHEIRTPLTSILGYSEMLIKELAGKLNEKQKEFISDIQISGVYLLGIINEILDLSKIEAHSMKLHRTEFDLTIAINEACNIVSPLAAQKEIDIETELEPVIINADFQKIQQIIFNLLSNAIKYTPTGGNIFIKVAKQDNSVVISVKDNGIGISKENHSRIFEKFEQAAVINKEMSTGLGLAITKEFVKLHKGKIKLISEPNKGAEFIIIIPVK